MSYECKSSHCNNQAHEKPPKEQAVLNESVEANQRTTLDVSGMDCADEIATLERVLKPLPGVRELRVNLISGKVIVLHDDTIDAEALIAAIETTGMRAALPGTQAAMAGGDLQRSRAIAVAISGLFTGLGLILHWIGQTGWTGRLSFAVAIVSGGWFIFPKAIAAARRFVPDMNLLMGIAVVGAIVIDQWSEAAAVTFLFGLSESLEAFSIHRARRAIESLLRLAPETAWVKRGESFVEVAVEQVKTNEIIAVKSGSRVPLDGVVVRGASSVDQAPITGESLPVEKEKGDPVFAGTINGHGSLEISVTEASGDTMLARIIQLVGEAQAQKAPTERFVDIFAKYYTPIVMVMALFVFVLPPLIMAGAWSVWFYRALVLLVIACPCALVISTPVTIVSGLTAMARRGVLVKGGAVLEAIGKLKALAVDKTGTITEGKPRVTKVISINSSSEIDILRIAAAIDIHSEHPLSKAVISYTLEKEITFPRCEDYKAHSGRGAEGVVDGHHYFVGNHRFTHELAVCSSEIEQQLVEIEADAQSVVVVGHKPHDDCKGEVLGILAVGDAIREDAPNAIVAFHRNGLSKVVMLSGDNQRTVNAIAKKAGIDEAYGDLLPDQKIERVKALMVESKYVGMIGDGVNDAPAMAAATVGIAMGAGTDTALETADMVLMQDDLGRVAEAIHLGRRAVRIIQFNIVFSLTLKALFLILALAGQTSLWLAIAADTGATLLVIANALRLLRPPSQ